ncbi:MAG: hypothetical protein IJD13_09795 [Oscillospiraceae bacterium]|nr:hypothetical protein [Oscillospiraceae bacterium]
MERTPMKIALTIVERGRGKGVIDYYTELGVTCHYQCVGRGTASSELMDTFGFGTTERDVIISIAPELNMRHLCKGLSNIWRRSIRAKGIAVVLDLKAMSNMMMTAVITKSGNVTQEMNGGEAMEEKNKSHHLILIAVDQGYTDEVMNTAREAGARGGTVIRARWAGGQSPEQFYGITLQGEKEIIAIVATEDNYVPIMESVNREHGIKSDAHGSICSLLAEEVMRIN